MQSRITIELDFDSCNPHIKVVEASSDDVRDKLLKFFREQLGHTSSWFKMDFSEYSLGDGLNIYNILPIKPEDLQKEGEAMLEQARLLKDHPEQSAITH